MILEDLLKFCREIRGITQSELHDLTGIPQFRISRFEAGSTEPRITELEKLSEAFDIPLEMMLRLAHFEKSMKAEVRLEEHESEASLIESLFKAYMTLKVKKESLRTGNKNSGDVFELTGKHHQTELLTQD
jgi:transcriptional regulator with XRE-family HTH domain